MDVIIPLAGEGKRLRPLTHSKPKSLIEVAGKPILAHLLDRIGLTASSKVLFVVGRHGDQIARFVCSEYNSINSVFINQDDPKGQAHSVYLAKDQIENDVLIVFGDTIADADYSCLRNTDTYTDGIIYVKEVDDPRRFGVVELNKDGTVKQIIEKPAKPTSNLVNIGIYYIRDSDRLFNAIEYVMENNVQRNGEYYLADVFNRMIECGSRFATHLVNQWMDCGTPDSLLKTNRMLLTETKISRAAVLENTAIIDPVSIGKDVTVISSVIGPYVSIGNGATVSNSVIVNSVIDRYASIKHSNLSNSILGEQTAFMSISRKVIVGDHSNLKI